MRYYITGSVGSGKTTFARQLSQKTGIACTHLDEVMHEPDPENPGHNRKRAEHDREQIFRSLLTNPDYIMEDAGRRCFFDAVQQADLVILLDPARSLRTVRILKRWVRQRLGVETCSYRPDFAMLRAMFRWARDYDTGKDGIRARVYALPQPPIVLRTKREIAEFLEKQGKIEIKKEEVV